MIGTGLLFAVTLLCLLFPVGLGEKANPQVTPEHIKPEWYFYFQFRLLKLSPGIAALGLTSLDVSVLLTGVMLAIVFLWPWIDRFLEKLAPGRNLPIYIGIAGFLIVPRVHGVGSHGPLTGATRTCHSTRSGSSSSSSGCSSRRPCSWSRTRSAAGTCRRRR